jgi:hypothetical protein
MGYEWFLTKYILCYSITTNMYFRVSFLFKKQIPIVGKSVDFNLLLGIVVRSMEKSYVLMLSDLEKNMRL